MQVGAFGVGSIHGDGPLLDAMDAFTPTCFTSHSNDGLTQLGLTANNRADGFSQFRSCDSGITYYRIPDNYLPVLDNERKGHRGSGLVRYGEAVSQEDDL